MEPLEIFLKSVNTEKKRIMIRFFSEKGPCNVRSIEKYDSRLNYQVLYKFVGDFLRNGLIEKYSSGTEFSAWDTKYVITKKGGKVLDMIDIINKQLK